MYSGKKLSFMAVRGCFLLAAIGGGSIHAASAFTAVDSLACTIHFRLSRTQIDTLYQSNERTLRGFRSLVDSLGTDAIQRVQIRSWASPEGSFTFNRWLAHERAASTRRLVGRMYPSLLPKLDVEGVGEAWQGLRTFVQTDTWLTSAQRDSVLSVLDAPLPSVRKKELLKRMPCYARLWKDYYVLLRSSLIYTYFSAPDVPVANSLVVPEADETVIPTLPIRQASPVGMKRSRGGFLGLKTNLLYDALLVPNVGIEVPVGRRVSLSANWMYAWWKNDHRHRYWRVYGGEVEARYWLRAAETGKPLRGHHVGIYAQMLTFDVEWGARGYMGGTPGGTLWNKAIGGGGLSYGYSFPLSDKLRLDLGIGLGYWGGRYHEYVPDEGCYVWQRTCRLRYGGPTRAEVSLVWWLRYGKSLKHCRFR